jgi:hypothetical protein
MLFLFLLLWFLVRNGSFDLFCVVINVVYFDFVDTDLNDGTICAEQTSKQAMY